MRKSVYHSPYVACITSVSNRYIAVTLSLGPPATTISPGRPGRAMLYLQDPSSFRSLLSIPVATHIRRDRDMASQPGDRPIRIRPRSLSRVCI